MDLRHATKIVEIWYQSCGETFTDDMRMDLQASWVQTPAKAMAKVELYKELLRIRFDINI